MGSTFRNLPKLVFPSSLAQLYNTCLLDIHYNKGLHFSLPLRSADEMTSDQVIGVIHPEMRTSNFPEHYQGKIIWLIPLGTGSSISSEVIRSPRMNSGPLLPNQPSR